MKNLKKLNGALLIAGVLACSAAYSQSTTTPSTAPAAKEPAAPVATSETKLGKDQVQAEKDRIKAAYKADKEACKPMKGNQQDICEAEAKAKEKVALAELKYKETHSERDRQKLAETKAKADYDVAKERCEDKTGNDQSVCKKEAKAAEKAAIANSKKPASHS
jgi:membrane-associated HD superfamily phosphohydrolase